MKKFYDWQDTIKTDFRVYWYGECEMWIDRIRVEDLPAKQLFERKSELMNQITTEINLAASNYDPLFPIPNNFYNEEFEFNMTPSTQELSKIIDSVSQSKLTLMVNINMDMYNVHVPHYEKIFDPADFKKYLLDSSKIKIILPNPYYLEGWEDTDEGIPSKNPNTLPVYSHWPGTGYDKSKGLLTYPVSPSVYDNWLQSNLDDNPSYYNFKTVMKKYDEISKLSGVDIIDLHQSHMWWQYNHKLKEPTNEELELTANLALTYGSKGFMYFAYNGECTGNGYQTDYTLYWFGGKWNFRNLI